MMIPSDRNRISGLEETVMLQRVAIKAIAIRLERVELEMQDQLAQQKDRARRAKMKRLKVRVTANGNKEFRTAATVSVF